MLIKMMIKSISVLIFLLSLTGCISRFTYATPEEPTNGFFSMPEDTQVAEAVAEVLSPVQFSVLYAVRDVAGSMYEPAEGAYLGAWLRPGMNKAAFEEVTGKKHAVFVMEMELGNNFPSTWILQSIAAQAAPLIVLHLPSQDEGDFPLVELAAFAHELGNFNLPAFIVFNPLAYGSNIDPDDYILLFRYARIIFRTYAPMAAFVWHGYNNTATAESPFYPGHDVVDWVSLQALAPHGQDGFIIDIPTYLKPFYLNFQQYKPIILLPIGVGHFSRRDYVYRVPQAAAEITRIYGILGNIFPRVKMIIYADHGITTPQGDYFGITREDVLVRAYGEAISDDHFISRLIRGNTGDSFLMRSALHGYYYQGEVFLDRGILETRTHRPIPTATKEINGRMYVSTNDINWMKISTDRTRRVIYIQ